MFSVRMFDGCELEVFADEYEIDEDGDLVFWAVEDEYADEPEMVEVGRVATHCWSSVFQVADVEDDEVEVETDEVE